MLFVSGWAQENYLVHYHLSGKDTLLNLQTLGVKTGFSSRNECILYMETLEKHFQSKGYLTFSMDSVRYDSLEAETWIYLGEQYQWSSITVKAADAGMFEQMGWSEKQFKGKNLSFEKTIDLPGKSNYISRKPWISFRQTTTR
jgi:hypothetical protein